MNDTSQVVGNGISEPSTVVFAWMSTGLDPCITGQFVINPQPELFEPFWVGFPYFSLPVGVTTRRFGRYKLPRLPTFGAKFKGCEML